MTMKTEEKTAAPELTGNASPLALVPPPSQAIARAGPFDPSRWGPAEFELIKKQVCPAGIPEGEFKLFVVKCQASGMNPLLGEAFCVKRKTNAGSRDNPNWIDVYQFTPGEQGMEGRADDFPDFRGLRAAAYYEKDKIILDPSTGEVSHQYSPVGDRGRLVGAWAIAFREGRKTPLEDVKLAEYADARNPKWAAAPQTMLVKCARAAALRRAYPNAFSGVFAREELSDGESAPTPHQEEQAARPTTDKLAERLAQTAAAQAALAKPASQQVVTVQVSKPAPTPPKAESPKTLVGVAELKADLVRYEIIHDAGKLGLDEVYTAAKQAEVNAARAKATQSAAVETKTEAPPVEAPKVATPPPPAGPVLVFGQKKGEEIAKLSGPELLEMIALGESKVNSLTQPAQIQKVRACIDALKAEEKAREAALFGPPEPGSDG